MYKHFFGIIPPLTAPFTLEGEIDEQALRAQVRFMLHNCVHGLAVGGSTGEGHTLSTGELRRLVEVTIEEASGLPVIAGIIVDSTRQAIEKAQALAGLKVAALQVTPTHYLFKPDDEATVRHFRAIAESSGLPVIIYNVVPWNYVSPQLLVRIMHEVPGVIGVKQSAGDLKLLADLLISAPEGRLILSAVDALLYPSFALGAHGTICALAAAAPGPCVELWDAVEAGDHERALRLHNQLLPLWNAMAGDNLPACVKYAQTLQGSPGLYPRAPMPVASPAQQTAIRKAWEGVRSQKSEARIAPVTSS
jgi:4-hydroxy-tetrahydrodipicolinate synthase